MTCLGCLSLDLLRMCWDFKDLLRTYLSLNLLRTYLSLDLLRTFWDLNLLMQLGESVSGEGREKEETCCSMEIGLLIWEKRRVAA